MDADAILDRTVAALDAVFSAAARHDGLAPAVLDCETARLPEASPEQVPGHRRSELGYPGANLLDDAALLSAARGLDAAGIESYEAAVDRYLTTFGCWTTSSSMRTRAVMAT